jgi:hypothetical protein
MPADLEDDLKAAIASFWAALAEKPHWIEARVGIMGCVGPLLFLAGDDYAYTHSTLMNRDLALAYAEGALVAAPEWHYVRDVLRPQIEALPQASPAPVASPPPQ